MEECDCDECCGLIIGPQGFTGMQGLATFGAQGPIGAQGEIAVGAQGNQGFQGPLQIGPQGFDGVQGAEDAIPASNGLEGAQGYQGLLNSSGPQGLVGNPGPQGFSSNLGRQGPLGYQGDASITGVQGYRGAQGRSDGVQGPIGFQGTAFASDIVPITTSFTITPSTTPTFLSLNVPTTQASYVRAVVQFSISVFQPFQIGLYYATSQVLIGPLITPTQQTSYSRQVCVLAREVPTNVGETCTVGIVAMTSSSPTITILNASLLRLYRQ